MKSTQARYECGLEMESRTNLKKCYCNCFPKKITLPIDLSISLRFSRYDDFILDLGNMAS
jgi:hypothetical protein